MHWKNTRGAGWGVGACLILLMLVAQPAAAEEEAAALYKAARQALSNDDYRTAAETYRKVVDEYPESDFAADALYWRAFSLYRLGETESLRAALEALNVQREQYQEAATLGDAANLETRIYGELAKRGDRESARVVSILADLNGDYVLTQRNWAEIQEMAARKQVELAAVQKDWEVDHESWERDLDVLERLPREPMPEVHVMDFPDEPVHRTVRIHRLPRGHHESDIRVAALNALVNVDPDRALQSIRKVFNRPDEDNVRLREEAVFLLTRIEGVEADGLLLKAAQSDPDPGVQAEAVMLLSSVSGDDVIDTIEDIVRNSEDPRILENAAFALHHHPSPRAPELLREFAADPTLPREVRRGSILVLASRPSPETLALLMELYEDVTAEAFKDEIIIGVSRVRTDESRRWLLEIVRDDKELMSARETALGMLMDDPDVATHDLVEIYNTSTETELRKTAIWLLSRKEDPEAARKLRQIAIEETDPELRLEAVAWIANTDDPEAAELLEKLIEQ